MDENDLIAVKNFNSEWKQLTVEEVLSDPTSRKLFLIGCKIFEKARKNEKRSAHQTQRSLF